MNKVFAPEHVKIAIKGGLPASGPLRGTAGRITALMLIQLIEPLRGRPAGGGGVHPNWGYGDL